MSFKVTLQTSLNLKNASISFSQKVSLKVSLNQMVYSVGLLRIRTSQSHEDTEHYFHLKNL